MSVADGWTEAWDSGKATDGIRIAQRIHDTLALAGDSGFVRWLSRQDRRADPDR
ncbi:hypothetical protein [Nonomuraea angiospora]